FICSAGMKKGYSFLSVDEPGKGIEFPGARNLREGLLMSSGAREQDAVHPVSVGAILVQFQRLSEIFLRRFPRPLMPEDGERDHGISFCELAVELNGSFCRCLGLRQTLVRDHPQRSREHPIRVGESNMGESIGGISLDGFLKVGQT